MAWVVMFRNLERSVRVDPGCDLVQTSMVLPRLYVTRNLTASEGAGAGRARKVIEEVLPRRNDTIANGLDAIGTVVAATSDFAGDESFKRF